MTAPSRDNTRALSNARYRLAEADLEKFLRPTQTGTAFHIHRQLLQIGYHKFEITFQIWALHALRY